MKFSRPFRSIFAAIHDRRIHTQISAVIEPLEARIAPATLVSPTTVTYKDFDGDNVTAKISEPLFTAANVNDIFHFKTGAVDGNNVFGQVLKKIDFTPLHGAAVELDLNVTATNGGGDGFASV